MEDKLIKINLNEVKVVDLDNNELIVKDFAKVVANALFTSAPTIELSDKARSLHKGETVDVTTNELKFLIDLFKSKQVFYPFAQLPLLSYLQDKDGE